MQSQKIVSIAKNWLSTKLLTFLDLTDDGKDSTILYTTKLFIGMNTIETEIEKILHIKLEKRENRYYYPDDLDLSETRITTLPENLSVGGDLDLSYSDITTLPENLSVGGSINLCGTRISSLPNNLSVEGNLDLQFSDITTLPENLYLKRKVYLKRKNNS